MTATVWTDPETLTHEKLAALVADIQDVIEGQEDQSRAALAGAYETIKYLLTNAGLGPRRVGT